MKKSSKRFTISTEARNSFGFRVKTEGVDLSDFNKNPLLLWMHKRPKGERQDEILPLGYWTDIQVQDGRITGVPMFDESDPFAMKIYQKVENSTIKMASAGLKPGEFEEIDGEKWLTKSSLQEGSLCDIGSNSEALAIALYNDNDEIINLAEFNQQFNINKKDDMKLIQLSAAALLPLLKLNEDATDADAQVAILNLVSENKNQATQIQTLKDEKKTLQDKIDLAENADKDAKAISLVDQAVKDRKITEGAKDGWLKLAKGDFETTKATLDGMEGSPAVNTQLNQGEEGADELLKLSWKELEDQGKLVKLREANFDAFKEKFKKEFGAEYKG